MKQPGVDHSGRAAGIRNALATGPYHAAQGFATGTRAPCPERDASMTTLTRRPVRPFSPDALLPRLVLLPALHPDADPRPALLPAQPRAVPVLFPNVSTALAELRRLQGDRA